MVNKRSVGEAASTAATDDAPTEICVLAEPPADLGREKRVAVVEATRTLERLASVCDVASLEERARPLHPDGVVPRTALLEFIGRGIHRTLHDVNIAIERGKNRRKPTGSRQAIVVGEGQQRRSGSGCSSVPRRRWATVAVVTDNQEPQVRTPNDVKKHVPRAVRRRVIDDDNLKVIASNALSLERADEFGEVFMAAVRGD
jgi:hypothetical protein